MVDSSKRRYLKSLGAMMAMPLVPAIALPTTGIASVNDPHTSINAVTDNEELTISLILGDKPMMRVTNNTNTLSILRRIHPGVVHAGDKTYDLNHSLSRSSYAIGGRRSRLIPVTEALGVIVEPSQSTSYSRKPLRVATISSDNDSGRILHASRVFFT